MSSPNRNTDQSATQTSGSPQSGNGAVAGSSTPYSQGHGGGQTYSYSGKSDMNESLREIGAWTATDNDNDNDND
ncbi:hypothetical protein N7532_010488 [Penicillium argentinense]|uniref:Uncharacterized protein n=1 Tax=Penicillium argentinense TaxID=1131581 RepID=A0A9W9EPQ5_9EURO|nr:uncharacterized protein N7532_010488 [Penicillium argentinense]KAJ5085717.1 hypothetical protein N7532_010488 [Penicillium argentinense]